MTAQDKLLAEIAACVKATRRLIEVSTTETLPLDGAATAVLMTSYIMMAKRHGMTKEQFMRALDSVWALDR